MTETSEAHNLHPKVKELLEDFSLQEGKVFMPSDALARWKEELKQAHDSHKSAIVLDLVALSVKFQRLAPGGSKPGILQLLELAYVLHSDKAATENLFEQGGVDLKRAAELTGAREAQFPSSEPPPTNSLSLADLMLGRKK